MLPILLNRRSTFSRSDNAVLKAIRYALAAICLTASVGCLALWWRSETHRMAIHLNGTSVTTNISSSAGYVVVFQYAEVRPTSDYTMTSRRQSDLNEAAVRLRLERKGKFGVYSSGLHFPLWYPALVFAIAAVAAIRVGRQFTLRSALVGMSVVAVLLGMVVAL
jgi:hypothetical protein